MSFDFKKRLGAGHFGEVWLATDLGLNVDRAVKLIPLDRVPDKSNFFREAQILKEAEHQNIVKVEATGTMPAPDDRIFVAMEYLPRGSVDDEARGDYLPLTRAKKIMIDVLRGLEWAHGKGIIHHDIKPGNILIGNAREGKLSDFGLALRPGKDAAAVSVKNYNYLLHVAPETFEHEKFSERSDIYACGVTLYRMVNGDAYLPTVPPIIAAKRACKGEYPDRTKYRAFIPRGLRMVINRAMSVDPSERFQSALEMRRALERIELRMNWREVASSSELKWTTAWDERCYQVLVRASSDSRFDVVVSRGESKASLRRIGRLCVQGQSHTKALQIARRVLQDFVTGKER